MTSNSSSQEFEEFSRLKREHERLKLRFDLQCQQKDQELEFERREIEKVEKTLRQELSSLSTAMGTLKRENSQLKNDRAQLEGLVERLEEELKRVKTDRGKQEIIVLEDGPCVKRRDQEVQTESTSVRTPVVNGVVAPHLLEATDNSSEGQQLFSENIEDRMRSVSLAPGDENRAFQDNGGSVFGGEVGGMLQHNGSGTEENGDKDDGVSTDEVEQMDVDDVTGKPALQHSELNLDEQASDAEADSEENGRTNYHGTTPPANETMQTTTKNDGDESAMHNQPQRLAKPSSKYCRNAIQHLFRWSGIRAPSFFKIPPKILYTRLQPLGLDVFPLSVDEDVLDQLFTRIQLKKVHGVEPREVFSKVSRASASQYGYSRTMCLDWRLIPFAPRFPGAPGLFFSPRDPDYWPKTKELIISGLGNVWNVMGEYKMEQATPLSQKEFRILPDTARDRLYDWACSDNRYNLAKDALDKCRTSLNCPPDAQRVGSSVKWIVLYSSLTEAAEAFWGGKETLLVWTMKCVGYAEGFKRALIPPGGANSVSAKPCGRKRQRSLSSTSGEESYDSDGPEVCRTTVS